MTISHDTDEDVTKYLSGMSKREKWFHLELVARKVPTLVDSTFLESFRPGFKIGLLGIKIGFLGLKIGLLGIKNWPQNWVSWPPIGFQLVIKIGLLGIKLGFLGLKIGFQLGFGVSFAYHLQWCGFSLFTALVNLITLEIVRMWGFSRMEIGVNFEDMRALM